ncbi:MAG: aminodeoxychorismate/anthranilate synthase component II [Candidatus Omnitrophica bacterium]|nr:aminodeoxychorismate/anthranilate synthase component II [Candidatus Omnitrophota bacterium]
MILIIDNYDSFTYNLVQYFGELGAELEVYRNDKISIDEVKSKNPQKIVISPGPGEPKNAGISESLIRILGGKVPLLGVCLGHQAIGEVFGGRIVHAKNIMHGKTSLIYHNGKEIFAGIKNPFEATRYHSLVVERKTLPDTLSITAETKDKDEEIMGLKHNDHPVWGVQFHPESILTGEGMKILSNFLKI